MNFWKLLFGTKDSLNSQVIKREHLDLQVGTPIVVTFNLPSQTRWEPENEDCNSEFDNFEPKRRNIEPKPGDSVSFWARPDTTEVWAYLKGTVGSEGLIGITRNESMIEYLKKRWYYEASIVLINQDSVSIKILFTDSVFSEVRKNEISEKLKKRCKPNFKPWVLIFAFSEPDLIRDEVTISCNDLEATLKNLDHLNENFWLINQAGEKVSSKNFSSTESAIKTLRSYFSGYRLNLEFSGREGERFFFSASIKDV